MATWKKLIVSGSNISQLNNDVPYLKDSDLKIFSTASINGVSLTASNSNSTITFNTGSTGALSLTGTVGTSTVIANVLYDDTTIGVNASNDLILKSGSVSIGHLDSDLVVTSAEGIANNDNDTTIATNAAIIDFVESASAAAGFLGITGSGDTNSTIDFDTQALTFAGEAGVIATSASAQTLTVSIVDGGVANAKLTNDSITIGDSDVALGESYLTQLTHGATGSFTGSFVGDGSGLTGLVTNLNVSGSDGSGISIDLKTEDLTIGGTANEIETTAVGNTLTIGLPNDVTITQDLTVNRNLTVIGTASFQHETNLEVTDRFIRLASGSSAEGDGGIVIQQSGDGLGDVFGFDGATSDRWGVAQSFNGSDPAFTPEAFMALALTGSNETSATIASQVGTRYSKLGNIYVDESKTNATDANIWIYA